MNTKNNQRFRETQIRMETAMLIAAYPQASVI